MSMSMSLSLPPSVSAPSSALTTTQEHVLSHLCVGSTITAAAESAGVHRNTIAYWRRTSPVFCEELHHAQYEKAMYWREQAETLASAALDVIRTVLADPKAPPSVRVKAALNILDKATIPPPPIAMPAAAQSVAPAVPPPQPEDMHKNAQKSDLTHTESTPADAVHKSDKTNPIPPGTSPYASPRISPRVKIGRNDPCPCGSGKKFKRCCIDKSSAGEPESTAA